MDCEIVPIDVYTDQEEVAHMFREYGWMSALVVDNKGRLIGVINIDDVVDIVHEEASEDIMHLSGAEERRCGTNRFSAFFRSRSVWLITNLFATILASTVVKEFQDIIAEISVLAVLMPIVASMGGTTGNQTLAVVVRALATKELTSPQYAADDWQGIYGRCGQWVFVCLSDRSDNLVYVSGPARAQRDYSHCHALQFVAGKSGWYSYSADTEPF